MYDIIIIGAGCGGLTAGIYARMANRKVLIIEKSFVGGQIATIHKIKNYPGFEEIDGFELAEKMRLQAKNLGVEFVFEEVSNVELNQEIKKVQTHKNAYEAKAVIIATGAYVRQLEVENEREFFGKGVSYCATCDGNFYKDKTVAVVGGGNTSFEDCLYLANLAKKVYLIHRREIFTGNENSKIQIQELSNQGKIEILPNNIVTKILGSDRLEKVEITNKVTNQTTQLNIDGLFIAIGRNPDTELFKNQIQLDEKRYIVTDVNMQTNIKNVFAVGDVRNTPFRQIVTACGDGAIAVASFLKNLNKN